MAKFKYRNTSENELIIPNVGVVKAKGEITSDIPLENPNLEVVSSSVEKREETVKGGK